MNYSRFKQHCLLISFSCLLPTLVQASGLIDPFDTQSKTPPPPELSLPEHSNFVPCQIKPANTNYNVIDVVDQTLCNNPKTRESWANARAQAAQFGIAKSAYLPSLTGKAGASRNYDDDQSQTQKNASLTLSWLIYDFGNRAANLENAQQLLNAAASTLDANVQSIFLVALQSYYNAQAARAALVAAQVSEKSSLESFNAAETRYRVGTGTPADKLQAQTAWSQATLNRIKAEGVLKNTMGSLANVMGLDANTPILLDEVNEALPPLNTKENLELLIQQAKALRPDLMAAEAQVKAAQSNIEIARTSGLPTLSLGAGPSWQEKGNVSSHSSSIGLTLTIPFFSGYETTYRVHAAKARAEAAEAQRDNVLQQVSLDVWNAYQNLNTALQSIQTSEDLLKSASKSEEVALGRYKAGVGNILDVLNAQSALAQARVQKIQSMLDWRISRATLAKAVGQLDGRLLDFPEQKTNAIKP